MFASQRDKRIALLLAGQVPGGFPADLIGRAVNRLLMPDAAISPERLNVPPGNRPEPLSGDRKGQYPIRINEPWRIGFVWRGNNAHDVEIVDHHR